MTVRHFTLLSVLCGALTLVGASSASAEDGSSHCANQQVIVPEEDRFLPFAITIRPGECVEWVNQDTDDHTVVSNDAFNTTGHRGIDHVLPGTDNNGGEPSHFVLRFKKPGTFHYNCRFH